jgi:hypothetical protein
MVAVNGLYGTPHEPPRDVLAAEEFALPAPDPMLKPEPPRDVLAAEEFALPAPDPMLKPEAPRDVLAAEEFALPAPDPMLRPERLELPTDLVGGELRDVLVAEEFAIPAPSEAHEPPSITAPAGSPVARRAAWKLGAALALYALWRGRRARRRQNAD